MRIKKQKAQKSAIKRKREFKICKNCLKATQLESKIKYLEKSKIGIISIE